MDAPPRGPYVKAALFCDRVLEEKSGVVSIIRVIDRLTHTIVAPQAPESLPRISYPMFLVVMLNPGDAKGRSEFRVEMEPPGGLGRTVLGNGSVHFESPSRGINITIQLNMTFDSEGVYWFEFLLEGNVLTRMPFEVRYNRITPGTATQA